MATPSILRMTDDAGLATMANVVGGCGVAREPPVILGCFCKWLNLIDFFGLKQVRGERKVIENRWLAKKGGQGLLKGAKNAGGSWNMGCKLLKRMKKKGPL